jgi:hypothetical protein
MNAGPERGHLVRLGRPSPRPGACDPCRTGQHHACTSLFGVIGWDCTCYDDAWEAHDRLLRQ